MLYRILLCMLLSVSLVQAATSESGPPKVVLNPSGTGAGATGELKFKELVANGQNAVGFKAPDTISADKIWTLPGGDGTSGQVLQTNGSGVLSWATPSAGGPSDGDKGDITISGSGATYTIDALAVTFAKFQNIATDRLVGRDTASSGSVEEISVGGGLEFTGSAGIQRSALTGDVTASAGSNSTTIATAAISGKASESTIADGDEILINDLSESGGTLNKATRGNILGSTLAAFTNGASVQGVRYYMQDATPSGPTTDDLWYETDTNIMWFYDGTRWLSTQLFEWKNSYLSITGTTDVYLPIEIDPAIQHDIFLVGISGSVYQFNSLAATATNYWKVGVSFLTDNLSGGEIANFTTQNDTVERFNVNKTAINSAYDLSSTAQVVVLLRASIAAGSPGALLGAVSVTYRWIHL